MRHQRRNRVNDQELLSHPTRATFADENEKAKGLLAAKKETGSLMRAATKKMTAAMKQVMVKQELVAKRPVAVRKDATAARGAAAKTRNRSVDEAIASIDDVRPQRHLRLDSVQLPNYKWTASRTFASLETITWTRSEQTPSLSMCGATLASTSCTRHSRDSGGQLKHYCTQALNSLRCSPTHQPPSVWCPLITRRRRRCRIAETEMPAPKSKLTESANVMEAASDKLK